MIWSVTLPTDSGWYWVSQDEDCFPAFFNRETKKWWHGDDEEWLPLDGATFGPLIPSPEQCAEIAKGGAS